MAIGAPRKSPSIISGRNVAVTLALTTAGVLAGAAGERIRNTLQEDGKVPAATAKALENPKDRADVLPGQNSKPPAATTKAPEKPKIRTDVLPGSHPIAMRWAGGLTQEDLEKRGVFISDNGVIEFRKSSAVKFEYPNDHGDVALITVRPANPNAKELENEGDIVIVFTHQVPQGDKEDPSTMYSRYYVSADGKDCRAVVGDKHPVRTLREEDQRMRRPAEPEQPKQEEDMKPELIPIPPRALPEDKKPEPAPKDGNPPKREKDGIAVSLTL